MLEAEAGATCCNLGVRSVDAPVIPPRMQFRFSATDKATSTSRGDGAVWTFTCRSPKALTRGDVRKVFGALIDE